MSRPAHTSDPFANRRSGAALCVLASGSSGNCSVLAIKRDGVTRVVLIDLGLSPRRVNALLAGLGLGFHQIDCCIVTHLDADHFQPSWLSRLPHHASIRMHRTHAETLERSGVSNAARVRPFESAFDLDPDVRVDPLVMSHDQLGVATLRFDLAGVQAGVLGFATDLGHVTAELVDHMRRGAPDSQVSRGVDVLAIESNYCPNLQLASDRPDFLKRRIMGGHGHLSNQQALDAVHAIEPKEHVVLLHLSRQCNRPDIPASMHEGADYALTISGQFEPTRWIHIEPSARSLRPARFSPELAATATLWTESLGTGR